MEYYIRTAPASVPVPVGVGTNAAGSRLPGTSLPPHSVLYFQKKQTRIYTEIQINKQIMNVIIAI